MDSPGNQNAKEISLIPEMEDDGLVLEGASLCSKSLGSLTVQSFDSRQGDSSDSSELSRSNSSLGINITRCNIQELEDFSLKESDVLEDEHDNVNIVIENSSEVSIIHISSSTRDFGEDKEGQDRQSQFTDIDRSITNDENCIDKGDLQHNAPALLQKDVITSALQCESFSHYSDVGRDTIDSCDNGISLNQEEVEVNFSFQENMPYSSPCADKSKYLQEDNCHSDIINCSPRYNAELSEITCDSFKSSPILADTSENSPFTSSRENKTSSCQNKSIDVLENAEEESIKRDLMVGTHEVILGKNEFDCCLSEDFYPFRNTSPDTRPFGNLSDDLPNNCQQQWLSTHKQFDLQNDEMLNHCKPETQNTERKRKKKQVFSCVDCSYQTQKKSLLKAHSRVHREEKHFTCAFCPFKSKYKCSVRLHTKLKHEPIKDPPRPKANEEHYECSLCNFSTKYESSLRRHVKRHSKMRKNSTKQPGSVYNCHFCDEVFTDSLSLYHHTEGHKKRYYCKLCGYTADKTSNLKLHIFRHLKRENRAPACVSAVDMATFASLTNIKIKDKNKSFVCDLCPYECASQSYMTRHKKAVHPEKYHHKCSECSFTCNSRRALYGHYSEHPRELPHACDKCNYRAKSIRLLKKHSKVHSERAIHNCPKCAFSAHKKSSIIQHLKRHGLGAKDYISVMTGEDISFESDEDFLETNIS